MDAPAGGGRLAPGAVRVLQVVAGAGLLIAGVASLANRTGGLANIGASAGAIAVVVGGLAMFAAPAIGRLLRTLDEERATRIREDERARLAAHLHDSVLQSLVLIQRSDDPRRMTALARRQERALRSWLYGGTEPGDPTTLAAAIEVLTAELEADHDVRIEAVIVGDQPLDASAAELVAALREALVNAARHAEFARVDVFVEVDDAELTGFVRDTGKGFDPQTVPANRRGISESIVGRLRPRRRHGHADVAPGRRHRGRAAHPPGAPIITIAELGVRRCPERTPASDRPGTAGVAGERHDRAARAGRGPRPLPGRGPRRARRPTAGARRHPQIEVVGEAGSVEEAVAVLRATPARRRAARRPPSRRRGAGGAWRRCTTLADAPRFLALSVSDAAEDVIAVVRAGARGYVTKTIDAEELLAAVLRVHDGDAVFSPRLAGFVLDAFSGDLPAPTDPELDLLTGPSRKSCG